MSTIVIVYHRGYGHTKKVAEAVLAGALEADAQAKLMPICYSSPVIGPHSPHNRSCRCHVPRASSFFRAAPHVRSDEVLK
ncbi:hypothetical protein BH160DRAFT_2479 [Burkholderia sp. H160]|nr:hypothetical protein BH160DRAFT_2479 [Burkholderia sp. H160]